MTSAGLQPLAAGEPMTGLLFGGGGVICVMSLRFELRWQDHNLVIAKNLRLLITTKIYQNEALTEN